MRLTPMATLVVYSELANPMAMVPQIRLRCSMFVCDLCVIDGYLLPTFCSVALAVTFYLCFVNFYQYSK